MVAQRITISRRGLLQGMAGLAGAGLAGGIAGCGNAASSAGTTTLRAWINRPENRQAFDSILEAFVEDHPDAVVEMEYKPAAQYPTLIRTELVAGAGPDVMATNGADGIWGDTGADGGYILPLDDDVPVDELTPVVREAITYDGHVYGSPVQTFRIGVYYQRSMFAKHGLEPPQTWDDLFDICDTLQAADITPWSMPAQDFIVPHFFYHLAVSSVLGPHGLSEIQSGARQLTDPDLVPAAQLLIDMAPYFNEGYQAVAYAEGKALFAGGRTAMVVGGTTDYGGYLETNPSIDVGFFGFPTPDGAAEPQVLNGLSMAFTVNKATEHAEQAREFVAWMAGEQAQQLIADTVGVPARQGIVPAGDDSRAEILRDIIEMPSVPTWTDYPSTGGIYDAVESGGGIFSGRMTAADLAALAQSAVKSEAP